MINIDTRLLNQVTPDQLYLLCQIVNFMNENKMCFPSNKKLIMHSKFSESKILRVKNEFILKAKSLPNFSDSETIYYKNLDGHWTNHRNQ